MDLNQLPPELALSDVQSDNKKRYSIQTPLPQTENVRNDLSGHSPTPSITSNYRDPNNHWDLNQNVSDENEDQADKPVTFKFFL